MNKTSVLDLVVVKLTLRYATPTLLIKALTNGIINLLWSKSGNFPTITTATKN
jgi:hypothetical protein